MLRQKGAPVQKRGGSRRPVKAPIDPAIKNAIAYYGASNSGARVFAKKQSEYRYLICTDLEPDDMFFLAMFTAWFQANEKITDPSTAFPIYGMIVGEGPDLSLKVRRARDFMERFADILLWNDPECNKWTSYQSSLNRIWVDSTSDREFEREEELASECKTEPPIVPFATTGFSEIQKVKGSNLFLISLKPLRFMNTPEILQYFLTVPGVLYGSGNVRSVLSGAQSHIQPLIQRFLNRASTDAPLVYTESYLVVGNDRYITNAEHQGLFTILEDTDETTFADYIRHVMYTRNEHSFGTRMELLIAEPEFTQADPDDHRGISRIYDSLSQERKTALQPLVQWILRMLQNDYKQLRIGDQLAYIAMLLGFNKTFVHPFKLQQCTIDYSGEYMIATRNGESNTYALLPKGDVTPAHVKSVKSLLVNMIKIGLNILDTQ